MRMNKALKADIDELLQEGLTNFLARWENSERLKDELRYDRMSEIVDFLNKKLKLGGE